MYLEGKWHYYYDWFKPVLSNVVASNCVWWLKLKIKINTIKNSVPQLHSLISDAQQLHMASR